MNGYPLRAKAALSFMPDEPYVYPFMMGREYLSLIARIKAVDMTTDIGETIERLNLENYLDVQFKHMSFGTQRKMTLVGALIGAPRVLLMDEPMNGLDAHSQELLINRINVTKNRAVIIFTSHQRGLIERTGAAGVFLEDKES